MSASRKLTYQEPDFNDWFTDAELICEIALLNVIYG
jgi:phosphoenolpyruvate carboxylase